MRKPRAAQAALAVVENGLGEVRSPGHWGSAPLWRRAPRWSDSPASRSHRNGGAHGFDGGRRPGRQVEWHAGGTTDDTGNTGVHMDKRPLATYLVYLSATVLAPYESGLIFASKPLPVTIPTISRISPRVSPEFPTSR